MKNSFILELNGFIGSLKISTVKESHKLIQDSIILSDAVDGIRKVADKLAKTYSAVVGNNGKIDENDERNKEYSSHLHMFLDEETELQLQKISPDDFDAWWRENNLTLSAIAILSKIFKDKEAE